MNLRHRLLLALPFLAVALASAPASGSSNDNQAKDVRVVNTPAERVPVTATGTVGLEAGTQVGISGAVSLAPGTRVDVSNTPDNPIHVAAPVESRDVFVRTLNLEWIEGAPNAFAGVDVPLGKRFIIEYVGGSVSTGEGATVDFTINTHANGGGASFRFPAPGRHSEGGSEVFTHIYRFAEAVRLYHDAGGSTLRVGGSRSVLDTGPARGTFSVSGYLVDLP